MWVCLICSQVASAVALQQDSTSITPWLGWNLNPLLVLCGFVCLVSSHIPKKCKSGGLETLTCPVNVRVSVCLCVFALWWTDSASWVLSCLATSICWYSFQPAATVRISCAKKMSASLCLLYCQYIPVALVQGYAKQAYEWICFFSGGHIPENYITATAFHVGLNPCDSIISQPSDCNQNAVSGPCTVRHTKHPTFFWHLPYCLTATHSHTWNCICTQPSHSHWMTSWMLLSRFAIFRALDIYSANSVNIVFCSSHVLCDQSQGWERY